MEDCHAATTSELTSKIRSGGVGATGLALVVTVTSQAWSVAGHANRLTFSGAAALPGVVLPAGTSTFEIANPDTGANVVQAYQPRFSKRQFRMRHCETGVYAVAQQEQMALLAAFRVSDRGISRR